MNPGLWGEQGTLPEGWREAREAEEAQEADPMPGMWEASDLSGGWADVGVDPEIDPEIDPDNPFGLPDTGPLSKLKGKAGLILETPFTQVVFTRARSVGKETIRRELSRDAASRERVREAVAKLHRASAVSEAADSTLFAQRFHRSFEFRLIDLPLVALRLLIGEDLWEAYCQERNAQMRWEDDGGPSKG